MVYHGILKSPRRWEDVSAGVKSFRSLDENRVRETKRVEGHHPCTLCLSSGQGANPYSLGRNRWKEVVRGWHRKKSVSKSKHQRSRSKIQRKRQSEDIRRGQWCTWGRKHRQPWQCSDHGLLASRNPRNKFLLFNPFNLYILTWSTQQINIISKIKNVSHGLGI